MSRGVNLPLSVLGSGVDRVGELGMTAVYIMDLFKMLVAVGQIPGNTSRNPLVWRTNTYQSDAVNELYFGL